MYYCKYQTPAYCETASKNTAFENIKNIPRYANYNNGDGNLVRKFPVDATTYYTFYGISYDINNAGNRSDDGVRSIPKQSQ